MRNVDLERQERFCLHYAIEPNGTKAAIEAGYSKTNARHQAWKLLSYPHVQRRINELTSLTAEKLGITREKVMRQYWALGTFDIRKIYDKTNKLIDLKKLDDASAAAIAGVEVESILEGFGTLTKVKVRDSRAALDSLVKMLGWNAAEKTELSGPEGTGDTGIENLSDEERLLLFRLRQKMRNSDEQQV